MVCFTTDLFLIIIFYSVYQCNVKHVPETYRNECFDKGMKNIVHFHQDICCVCVYSSFILFILEKVWRTHP